MAMFENKKISAPEFEKYCLDLFERDLDPSEFKTERHHKLPSGREVDIYIAEKRQGGKKYIIECKHYQKDTLSRRKEDTEREDVVDQTLAYKREARATRAVILISSATKCSENLRRKAEEQEVEIKVVNTTLLRGIINFWSFEAGIEMTSREEGVPVAFPTDNGDRQPGRTTMQKIDLIKPTTLTVEEETLTSSYGRFSGEPFERGFGTTIGNALRRVLLSSLTGAAITKVRINGVLHEFSTVSGMTEDVTDLLLNLKEVRFRLEDTDEETIRLDVQGQREVTAADLTVGAQVEILNPDKRLASLGKDTSLEFEAVVQTGRGYVTAERHKSEEDPIGTIPLDAAFSPVRKVNIAITNARVGQRTDYERLALEVWTDGSLKPEEAVASAARIIQDQLNVFAGPGGEQEWRPETGEEPAVVVNENLLQPIEELNLSVRSANCLQSADLRYVGELVQRSEADLLKTKNFGRKSLNEIKETLQSMGLELGLQLDDFPPREELDLLRAEHEPELSS